MESDLQRIDVKILAEAPENLRLDPFLAIFGRWRQDKENPSRWVDLADYAHMPKGPGIVLIGKQGNFGVNVDDPGLGVLYSGRSDFEGPPEKRFLEAFRRCLALAEPLLQEPDYPAELKLLPGAWELFVNDRLNFPNTDETDQRLRQPIQAAMDTLFGAGNYELQRDPDAQRRYAFSIRAAAPPELAALLAKANGAVR